ncbi:MAG TPA: hypothetical protein PKJ95_00415, partial [Atribacterota bacterium]|nr:hypothetical protein [Atribacterota bacterium]
MAQKVLYNNAGRTSEIALSPSSVDLGNVTNDLQIPKSIVTTKGDIITATDNATPVRQGVGSNGQIIVGDSNLANGLGYKDPAFRNWVINGNFDIAQRGTSFTNPPAYTYTLDRWRTNSQPDGGTPPNITHTQEKLTPGDVPGSYYFYRINVDGAGTSLGAGSYYQLVTYIEHATRKLAGLNKKVTLSLLARSSIVNKKIGVLLAQDYGTGGSPSSQELKSGTNWTLTSEFAKYTHAFTTNTLVGKTFGTNNDDALVLVIYSMWGSSSQSYVGATTPETFVGAGNIDIAQVALYAGDVAYPFEAVPFDIELQRCMRYYEKSYNYDVYPGTAATDGNSIFIPAGGNCWEGDYIFLETKYKVTKRIAGTPIIYDTAGTINKVTLSTNNTSATPNISGVVFSPTVNNFGCYGRTTNVAHRGIQYAWYVDAGF